jgi:uncharacterized protein (TIGR03382 family)
VVNGFAFRWAVGDDCRSGADDYEYDLESTLAHEIGHALGLRHSLDQEATMYTRPQPCARDRRDLSADDVEAIADLYAPSAGDLPGAFGCSAAGGGGAPLAFIAVAAVFAVRRRKAQAAARCAG